MRNLLNRPPADVAPVEALGPIDPVNGCVGALLGFFYGLAQRCHVQHATAIGHQHAVFEGGAGVEDFNAFYCRSGLEAANFCAFRHITGIALGAHDHGEGHIGAPAHGHFVEGAIHAGEHQGDDVVFQAEHEDLGFGIAKAGVVFDELGAIFGENKSGIEDADIGVAHIAQRADGRADDLFQSLGAQRLGHAGRWRIGPHAAGVGAQFAFAHALVVLGRGQGKRVRAIGEHEEAGFLALKEFLDHACGAAEFAGENIIKGGDGFFHCHRHGDALAGGQAIGLDDDGSAVLLEVCRCRRLVLEAAIGGGGDVVPGADILGEALGAFKLGREFRGAEDLDADGAEIIGKACDQRALRPHHDQGDGLGFAKCDDCPVIADIDISDAGELCYAGIAGGAKQRVAQRAGGDRPGQRMFAATGANEKNVHEACLSPSSRI